MGVQPSLALTYSSQAPIYGGIAVGWSLSVPDIHIDTSVSLLKQFYQLGFDNEAWRTQRFVSSMAGGRPLIEVTEPHNADVRATYRAQNDSTFARYERMVEGHPFRWRVRTLEGLTHYFGDRLLDLNGSEFWPHLSATEDAYGNRVEYQWNTGELSSIRYTSNPSQGLAPFAKVGFFWDPATDCGAGEIGAQPEPRFYMTHGQRSLAKIRVETFESGVILKHTREISLGYDVTKASCTAKAAPTRVLNSIQESAWINGQAHVDLPAVKFYYNRFERSFDQQVIQPISEMWGSSDLIRQNLGWGARRQSQWPSIDGMLLDLDGDGLQDRVYSVNDPVECKFSWSKNLGRQPNGLIEFGPASTPQVMPRLPWNGATKNSTEWCSLSSQFTKVVNVPQSSTSLCGGTSGSYLAYRWMDMTGDGLPDLVTAVNHDPYYFDPNKLGYFGPWPACEEGALPACPDLDSACMADAFQSCDDGMCEPDQGAINACVQSAPRVPCGRQMRTRNQTASQGCVDSCLSFHQYEEHDECNDFPGLCQNFCTAVCSSGERVEPDGPGGLNPAALCEEKLPQERCEGYPWLIYANQGGFFSSTPQIKYQPIPLESDSGDSAFGGNGVASTRHAVQDLDGDGDLDAVVRGRWGAVSPVQAWLVFPGDGHGGFEKFADEFPYVWPVPKRAPVSMSCTSSPGGDCSYLMSRPFGARFYDVHQLSSLIDLNGDGGADLIWKHSPVEFDENVAREFPWQPTPEDGPIDAYLNHGQRFEYNLPTGAGFSVTDNQPRITNFSRSLVDASGRLVDFVTTGTRTSMARFIDIDEDGRPDLVEAGVKDGKWEAPELFMNGGSGFLAPLTLTSTWIARLKQTSVAGVGNLGDANREFVWQSMKDLVDMDGDGLPEAWEFDYYDTTNASFHRDSDSQPLRLLKHIDNGRGGVVDISYAPTTNSAVVTQNAAFAMQNAPTRQAMPRTQWVVSSLTTSDQWDGDAATSSYHYDYPAWGQDDEARWGFRGFESVTTTMPSGARKVDTYSYAPDWSGRLASTRMYSVEDTAGPRTISETTWQNRSLFGSRLWTFHPIEVRMWTCGIGQTEAQCTSTNSGFVKTTSLISPMMSSSSVSGGPWQAFVEIGTTKQDSEAYDAGDRRTVESWYLFSDENAYRLVKTSHAAYSSADGVLANDVYADFQTWDYDATYRQPQHHVQYFKLDGAGLPDVATRATTTWDYDSATGVTNWKQLPRHVSTSLRESYAYDGTKRFVTATTDQKGQVTMAAYEPGTGAKVWTRGLNSASCGPSCTNYEQAWTDVDGMGRPIATWVNRGANGVPWTKTKTGRVTYTDSIVSGARLKVVTEGLIDYGGTRWTRNETWIDGKGRPQRSIEKTGLGIDAVTTYDYDNRGNLATVTMPDPSATTVSAATVAYSYTYDTIGRPTGMRRPAVGGAVASGVDIVNDGMRQQTDEIAGSQLGPTARKVLMHDHFGRLTEVREYTNVGTGTYAATTYQYDPRDAVSTVVSADGATTQLVQDFAGRRTSIVRGTRTWTYGYDVDGNMTFERVPMPPSPPPNPLDYTTSFAIDPELDRPSSRLVATRGMLPADAALLGVGNITFSYGSCVNGGGRLCTVTHPNSTMSTVLGYDSEGNKVNETRTFNVAGVTGTRSQSAVFGPKGRVTWQNYADTTPSSTTPTGASFAYDDRAQPSSLGWSAPGVSWSRSLAIQTRNVAGLVTQRTAPLTSTDPSWRSFTSAWTYDKLSRVASQSVVDTVVGQQAKQLVDYWGQDDPSRLRHWAGSIPYDFSYQYDARHQLVTTTEAAGKYTAGFSFTAGGKLLTASVAQTSPLPFGSTVVPRNVTYQYTSPVDPDAPSALAVAASPNLRSYTYDTAGNMTTANTGNAFAAPLLNPTARFVYDGEDQLRRATMYGGTNNGSITGREEYYYDHEGKRSAVVTRSASLAVTAVRVFIGDAEIELTSIGGFTRSYAYLSLGTPVARIERNTAGTSSLELHFQGLANNTLVTMLPTGAIKSGFVYGPYGDVVQPIGGLAAAQRRRFNDEFRDVLTGLTYYGVRYYDDVLLGWTQADPMYRFAPDAAWDEPRRANLYTFSGENPNRYVDPDGRDIYQWTHNAGVDQVSSGLRRICGSDCTVTTSRTRENDTHIRIAASDGVSRSDMSTPARALVALSASTTKTVLIFNTDPRWFKSQDEERTRIDSDLFLARNGGGSTMRNLENVSIDVDGQAKMITDFVAINMSVRVRQVPGVVNGKKVSQTLETILYHELIGHAGSGCAEESCARRVENALRRLLRLGERLEPDAPPRPAR